MRDRGLGSVAQCSEQKDSRPGVRQLGPGPPPVFGHWPPNAWDPARWVFPGFRWDQGCLFSLGLLQLFT